MFKARIADFNILFEEYYNLLYLNIGDFEADFNEPDIIVVTTLEDIEAEEKISEHPYRPYQYEHTAAFRHLAEKLPQNGACVLHSCFINAQGRGIAFTARSGTGKTTHMRLWQEMLGSEMEIVNGDKPIVRFIDGIPYGYGSPWRGKENYGGAGRAPLTDICIIERAEKNETIPTTKEEAVMILLGQVYMPESPEGVAATMEIINKIVEKCRFWKIRCNMNLDAATTAYNAIFGKVN